MDTDPFLISPGPRKVFLTFIAAAAVAASAVAGAGTIAARGIVDVARRNANTGKGGCDLGNLLSSVCGWSACVVFVHAVVCLCIVSCVCVCCVARGVVVVVAAVADAVDVVCVVCCVCVCVLCVCVLCVHSVCGF